MDAHPCTEGSVGTHGLGGDADGRDADAAPLRGRKISKGKTKIRVEGFDDGKDEE